MNTTTNTQAPATVPVQIADLMDDLTGFHPALDKAVAALAELTLADLTTDQSMAVVAALGGLADGHFATLLGLVLRHIANPDTNRSLTSLTDDGQQTLRRLGAEYAATADDDYARDLAAQASLVIERSKA